MTRAFDPRTALPVEPVGRVLDQRLQPRTELEQWATDFGQRARRLLRQLDEIAVELRGLRLDAVAGFLAAAFVAGIRDSAHRGEKRLDRAGGHAVGDALQPAVLRQGLGRLARGGDRGAAVLVV